MHVHPSSLKLTSVWTLLFQFWPLEAYVSPFGFETALETMQGCCCLSRVVICLSRATEVCASQGDQVQNIHVARAWLLTRGAQMNWASVIPARNSASSRNESALTSFTALLAETRANEKGMCTEGTCPELGKARGWSEHKDGQSSGRITPAFHRMSFPG